MGGSVENVDTLERVKLAEERARDRIKKAEERKGHIISEAKKKSIGMIDEEGKRLEKKREKEISHARISLEKEKLEIEKGSQKELKHLEMSAKKNHGKAVDMLFTKFISIAEGEHGA